MLILYIFLFLNNLLFTRTTVDFVDSTDIRSKRYIKTTLIDEEKCRELRTICNNLSENDDLLILECILATSPDRLSGISKDCLYLIRNHSHTLIEDDNVKKLLMPICGNELQQLNCRADGQGHYLKCIMSNIRDIQDPDCNQALLRLENVAFTDNHLVFDFLEHCSDDIKHLNCDKFDPNHFSQLRTINCLQNKILSVTDNCKKEVFRLSEVQSNSIKLDAQLYIDCAEDHLRYCSNVLAGSGKVIPCLMHQLQLDQARIEAKCRQQLLRRQKLMAQDFRVSKGLIRACKEDIKKTHCRKQISSDKTVRLAQILLCLENVMKNGTKVDPECETEMMDHRKMLMEDYRLSPEIVNNCKNETLIYCKGFEFGGKTIHCLMNQALNKGNSINPRLTDKCLRALEDLVKEVDAGENWSVDPVLHQACDPVVKVACKNVPSGNARMMSCLMDNLRSESMTEDCENALIEIQYFVARDFKLDPQLYKDCKQDASQYCHSHAFEGDENEIGPSYDPEVLPCLYRHAYQSDKNLLLQKECMHQIQRVMRQRAKSVDLEPEIEKVCVRDLGDFCHDKFKKGEEMQCLQDNLDNLDDKCHDAVESYTEIEAQHVEWNPFISKYCGKIIRTICSPDLSNDDNGNVMECLIENKNNPAVKSNAACRASIEHFQLISLKNYKFTYKFKVACKTHAMRLCSDRAGTKSEVIACLSEHILNATIQKLKSSIPKECRQQLKAQIFQQREKIDYDPTLQKACAQDIKKFCDNVPTGNSQVLECLQTISYKQLTNKCGKEIFKIQKLEIYDNSVDYALLTMCAETIDQFCPHHEKETIFTCLKMNKDEKGFSKKCRSIVMHRVIEQNSNNLLNPALQQNCQADISKFCKRELMTTDEKLVGDSVIKCLKTYFKSLRLSTSCEKELADILRERALDINLNPQIRAACKNELETICKFEGEDSGKVEECLKISFINKNIATSECKQEVSNMIEESETDIQVDPPLQNACALDLLTFCNHIEQGNGRHIQCLKTILEGSTQTLTLGCKTKLKERLEMYKTVGQVNSPENLGQLYRQVTISPAKNYFVIILLMLVGGIFFIGVFCGRISKKKYRLLKNK